MSVKEQKRSPAEGELPLEWTGSRRKRCLRSRRAFGCWCARRVRSACCDQALLKRLRNQEREDGPWGVIGFAGSARMSEPLKEKMRMLPKAGWRLCREDAEVVCEDARLSRDPGERKAGAGLDEVRYLAVRVTRRQGGLFDDRARCKH